MRFAAELSLVTREFSRVRAEIIHADVADLSPLTPMQEKAAASRATAYIWIAATLERVVRDALKAAIREISSGNSSMRDIRLSLFSLICDSEFASIANRNRSAVWVQKVEMFARTEVTSPAVLSEDALPLDGKTIRADHFDTIWLVFGLANPSVPTPRHRFALKDLADGRNEVAHGHQDPVSFGRKKATSDLLRLTNQIDEVVSHLLAALDAYIDEKHYIR